MAFKLLAGAALAAVAFADEPVGTVIGIDLGTTYSVRHCTATPYRTRLLPLTSSPAGRREAPRARAASQQRCGRAPNSTLGSLRSASAST